MKVRLSCPRWLSVVEAGDDDILGDTVYHVVLASRKYCTNNEILISQLENFHTGSGMNLRLVISLCWSSRRTAP